MTFALYQFADEMEAVAELELTIVAHAQLTVIVEAFAKLQARARVRKNQRRLKARGLLLMGKAGAGKSTVIELCEELNPEVSTKDGLVKRVLVVEVPATPTKRALVAAILGKMGYLASKDVNSYDIIEEIAAKATLLGVEMIILDEAHHILDAKDSQDISEFLKSLLNKAGCGIVFAGLPDLHALRTSSQFDRRLEPDINLRAYDWTNKAERLEFLVLLNKLETDCIHLPEPSNFADQSFARRLYAATRGEIGLVTKYLSQALLLAKRRKLPRIDLSLLAEVDAAWHPAVLTADEVGFDQDLDLENDPDLESLILDARKVVIDKENNPFVCTPRRLSFIWQERVQRPDRYVAANKRTGRRARGTGPDRPKAFG
ncbi:TniB family NTP-binding protein [Sphingobium sp. RSMS]|uniref:TniB family NTP-binding protein n=1 Tax=Sphingobium sp. RSMS TaxID=520734 RepID=UPI0010F5B307|nr:TniB family NTP-binding protein [Sphingobium sp. RSMS]UXC90284.1 TniB family NTP-binding protein [Sphingobium sp. RSMS]